MKLLVDTFAENNTPIQVICLQETWFENSELIDLGLYQIENYHLVTKNRYASAHGGLACYIHRNWNYNVNPNTVDSLYWEELFIEITDPSNPKYKLNVGNFYRPPHTSITQLMSFIDYFTQKLSMLNTRENIFACGDFNINLLSITANEHHSSYLEGILSSGFLPTITLPTRLSKNSTLIDNIFMNKQEILNFAGILNNEISDHQIVAVDMDLVKPPNKTYYITVFSNSNETKQNFKNDLESKNIYNILNKEPNANPNENYSILETAIIDSMNAHLTKKEVKFNRRKHKRDPWIIILCYWYQKQEMTVRWGVCISDSFKVTNGVRQGGILSPQLCNIYIDGLSDILNKSVGGSIGGKRINHMLYADDLCIVSLSSAGLQQLLTICDQYCAMHSITFNVKISVCMFFRCSMNKICDITNVVLSGNTIDDVHKTKYLGVLLCSDMKTSIDVRRQTSKFYAQANNLLRNFRYCSDNRKCMLFRSFCTNMYCSPLWCNPTSSSIKN